jgi:archaeal chaperonin
MLANRKINSANYPILRTDFIRQTGKEAWATNLRLASLAASKIASCLGPMGAYKLVAYHTGPLLVTKVTKDAIDIVEELGIQHPAIKTLAEAAKIHRQDTGEGVSSLLVLLSSLLEQADRLIEIGVHPVAIIDGYKESAKKAVALIDECAASFKGDLDESLLRVIDCGTGLLTQNFRHALSRVITLVEENGQADTEKIRLEKKLGGTAADSQFVNGVIIKKEKTHYSMPDEVENPRVALVTKNLVIKPLEMIGNKVGFFPTVLQVAQPGQLQQYKAEENRLRSDMVEKVRSAGANVLLCGTTIDARVSDKLSREGIFALEMVKQHNMEDVATLTGANIVGDVSHLQKSDIGKARMLEVDKIPPEQIVILHCDRGANLLLRGSNTEVVGQLEKIVKKAIVVLKEARTEPKVVPGGGAVFEMLAMKLRAFARTFSGRQQLPMGAFADALETIPRSLATNCGLDPIDTMMRMRSLHAEGHASIGVGEQGCSEMYEQNVIELASTVKTIIGRAFQVASLLLKINDYFYVKDRAVFHKK